MSNAASTPDEAILTFKIDNGQPLELLDLACSLTSLGGQYKRFLQSNPEINITSEPKLFIKKISGASVEAELVEYAQMVLPHIQATLSLIKFAEYLKQVLDYFSAKSGSVKPKMERIDYEQIGNILNPIAKDSSAQYFISASRGGKIVVNFSGNSHDANAIQKRMERAQSLERLPQQGEHEKVLLYWHKTKNSPKRAAGDWAVIETIHSKPVKTIFLNESDKAKMLTEPLYARGYVVDVAVETIEGNPALYRITRVYDSIPRPSA